MNNYTNTMKFIGKINSQFSSTVQVSTKLSKKIAIVLVLMLLLFTVKIFTIINHPIFTIMMTIKASIAIQIFHIINTTEFTKNKFTFYT